MLCSSFSQRRLRSLSNRPGRTAHSESTGRPVTPPSAGESPLHVAYALASATAAPSPPVCRSWPFLLPASLVRYQSSSAFAPIAANALACNTKCGCARALGASVAVFPAAMYSLPPRRHALGKHQKKQRCPHRDTLQTPDSVWECLVRSFATTVKFVRPADREESL